MNSDEELLQAYQAHRSVLSIDELYRRYADRLTQFLDRYTGQSSVVDDAVQQTFVQVMEQIDSYRLGAPAQSWLFTIAANTARKTLDKADRRRTRSLNLHDAESLEAPNCNMAERLNVVQQLQPEELHLLRMVYVDRRHYSEVADALNKKPIAVRKQVERLKKKLRA